MNIYDRIPFLFAHVVDHPVAQNPSRSHNDVNLTERIQSRLHNPFSALPGSNRFNGRDSMTACTLDSIHDLIRMRVGTAATIQLRSNVVHDNLGTVRSQRQRHGPADATTRTSDHRNLVL